MRSMFVYHDVRNYLIRFLQHCRARPGSNRIKVLHFIVGVERLGCRLYETTQRVLVQGSGDDKRLKIYS